MNSQSVFLEKAAAVGLYAVGTDPKLHREVKLMEKLVTVQSGSFGVKFLLNLLEGSCI